VKRARERATLEPGGIEITGPGVRTAANPRGLVDTPMTVRAGLSGRLEGWTAVFVFNLVDDRVTLVEPVQLDPGTLPVLPDDVTTRMLRALTVPWLARAVRWRAERVAVTFPEWLEALDAGSRRPGQRGTSDDEYALWVKRREEAEQEAPDAPVKWMVERYGRPGADDTASIKAKLSKARQRGLVTFRPFKVTRKGRRLIKASERITLGGE